MLHGLIQMVVQHRRRAEIVMCIDGNGGPAPRARSHLLRQYTLASAATAVGFSVVMSETLPCCWCR